MRGDLAVAALALVAGCDALWGLDPIDPPNGDAAGGRQLDASHAHTGPFMHFAMDAIDGTATLDSVGGARATCGASCPLPVTGHIGGGLDFNANGELDQRLQIASTPGFAVVDEFSVAGWIQLTTLATEGCPWSKPYSTGQADSWQLCINASSAVSFITYGAGGSNQIATVAGWAALDGTFHHVATVYDGVMKTLYWDGEIAIQGEAATPLVDADDVLIASDIDDGAPIAPINGVIDDVSFFAYALTPNEVAALAAK